MATLTADSARKLASVFSRQLDGLKNMLYILQQEYAALENNDRKAFDKAVGDKQLQVHALENLDLELKPVLDMTGGSYEKGSIDRLINTLDNTPIKEQLATTWEQLIDALNQCQEQNKINQRIIDASRINIQQTLDILLGENSMPKLYSPSGKQSTASSGHSIAVA